MVIRSFVSHHCLNMQEGKIQTWNHLITQMKLNHNHGLGSLLNGLLVLFFITASVIFGFCKWLIYKTRTKNRLATLQNESGSAEETHSPSQPYSLKINQTKTPQNKQVMRLLKITGGNHKVIFKKTVKYLD